MIDIFSFWFWLFLAVVVLVIYAGLEKVEDRRAYFEERRQRRIDRETARVLREMEQRQRLNLVSRTGSKS